MVAHAPAHASAFGPLQRLANLAPLNAEDADRLRAAESERRWVGPLREIIAEGARIPQPSIVLSGWACRMRHFSDGRRQVLGFLLPGDLIGLCRQSKPVAGTSVVALTEVRLCPAPEGEPGSTLAEAYAVSGALDELYLLRQVARMGRLNAYERIVDLLLELQERVHAAGLAAGDAFPMPLTQELLADALGLTSVHVNRTLQTMRRDGVLELRSGTARLADPERLKSLVDYRPAKVTEA